MTNIRQALSQQILDKQEDGLVIFFLINMTRQLSSELSSVATTRFQEDEIKHFLRRL